MASSTTNTTGTDKTTTSSSPKSHSAFFYGTLMAPQVLHRVIHGSTSPSNPIYTQSPPLTTTPALLKNHRRHRVRGADYPAIVPTTTSESSVLGTFVSPLTPSDIYRLDIFEGNEYTRLPVRVSLLDTHGAETGQVLECETYIWTSSPTELEDTEWDFAEFQREKMRFWVGAEGEPEFKGRESILEVDEAVAKMDGTRGRGANGYISNALEEEYKKSAN